MEPKYYFSVVIPVYKVEKYLEETIQSVLAQDIGFEEHIQLILVNDGSPDNSEEICLRYQKQYPDNIIYVKQENAGVSVARNTGLAYAEGKYVNFLDSDDTWEPNVFSQVYRFFEQKQKELDLVSCKLMFFDAQTGDHPLNTKFNDDRPERVIDLMNDYQDIQCHCTASFIKTETAKRHAFLPGLKFGEDALFINQILLEKRRYGVLTNAVCNYRRRFDESSAVQGQGTNPNWYQVAPRLYYPNLAEESIRLYGKVLPFVQYILFYDIGYRLKTPLYDGLTGEEQEEYLAYLGELLRKYVSDYVILSHRSHAIEFKLMALRLKYGDLTSHLSFLQQKILFDGREMVDLRHANWFLTVTSLEVKKDTLIMEGSLRQCILELLGEDPKLTFHSPGCKGRKAKVKLLSSVSLNSVYGEIPRFSTFQVTIPLERKKKYRIKPVISFGGLYRFRLPITFGRMAPLVSELKHSYCRMGSYLLEHNGDDLLISAPQDMKASVRTHRKLLEEDIEKAGGGHMLPLRKKVLWCKRWLRLTKKKLWLVSDRQNVAGDNGEAFFKYLCKTKPKNILPIFAISKTSPDYNRMKQYGKVVDVDSEEYKVLLLAANKLVSSAGTIFSYDPFGDDTIYVRDLMRRNYVFLQHGIIKDDLSGWMNRLVKNFPMVVTSTPQEKESVLAPAYGYEKSEIALVGLARYDTLKEKAASIPCKKQLLILPTWRKSVEDLPLADPDDTSATPYRLGFRETEFFRFYNELINHPRLLSVMEEEGYEGLFVLHPMLAAQARDFEGNGTIRVHEGSLVYSDAFAQSALLLTDYSSTFFDFGYLRKPVVYTHFDKEEFFRQHTYKPGYFSYEQDGFGPVCYDLESTVDELIARIRSGCKADPVYLERINRTFLFDDANNCKRTMDAILKLK